MPCPKPLIDDLESLQAMSGAKLAKAKPHVESMPIDIDEIGVLEDYRIVVDFLLSYGASSDTFKSYRREVDRFILWLWHHRKITLPQVVRADIDEYLNFLKNPPMEWRGTEVKHRFIQVMGQRKPNAEWRPFVTTISKAERKRGKSADEREWTQSASALKSTFAILRTFFEFLLNEDHVMRNPVAQIKARSRKATSSQRSASIKRLSRLQSKSVFDAVDKLQEQLDSEQYERLLFIISCLLGMYLRISEVASSGARQPVHGDFF
jgi:site-specific recombinase XerD